MAALVVLLLFFSMVSHSSATWCVCKKGGNDKVLQMAIDYACGNGADCTQTHQGGKCYNPDTVIDHCNYAVNSYFQNKRQAPDACNFNGAAMVVTTDPSANGCMYPSSASGTSTTVPGNTRTPGSTTVTASGGTTTSPYGNNAGNTGVLGGGVGPGLGPSGGGMNDVSNGLRLGQWRSFGLLCIVCMVMVLWG
ncbi:hypothetical protein L2E82_17006 [Cichorium intybus]|uniref:Uncharacterized protein n=1 Tax=Cichorium intybus TaxID=13427 RepID=A0ACB9F731_CICIN|nr:hypothetical protein L2E82_17006 [Cichorium intybus]